MVQALRYWVRGISVETKGKQCLMAGAGYHAGIWVLKAGRQEISRCLAGITFRRSEGRQWGAGRLPGLHLEHLWWSSCHRREECPCTSCCDFSEFISSCPTSAGMALGEGGFGSPWVPVKDGRNVGNVTWGVTARHWRNQDPVQFTGENQTLKGNAQHWNLLSTKVLYWNISFSLKPPLFLPKIAKLGLIGLK